MKSESTPGRTPKFRRFDFFLLQFKTKGHIISSIILVGIVSYFVLGGVASGDSEMLPGVGVPGDIIFVCLIFVLAILEGLEISIAKLSESFSDEAVSAFLAGRQLLTISTVFLLANLSSFPNLKTLPLTSIEIPLWLSPLVIVYLHWGLAGSLFVLWFGQQTPKILANRSPNVFYKLKISKTIIRTSTNLERTPLGSFAIWLANRFAFQTKAIECLTFLRVTRNCGSTAVCNYDARPPGACGINGRCD